LQLPADGDVGAGLDGGALQGHVHEGRSHQQTKNENLTRPAKKTKTKPKYISSKMMSQESGFVFRIHASKDYTCRI
jgi:hypothetical protein